MTNTESATFPGRPPLTFSVAPRQKLGVIDIGSNSVRLVVYDVDMQVPFQIFNEKVLSALGKGVSKTGRLNPEGRKSAQNAIRRFCAISQEMRVDRLIAVATAAVRNAADGATFVRAIERNCKIEVKVLSGEAEARYSALGVLAGIYNAEGLVGDLGGSSLELVNLAEDGPREGVSLPFGPLWLIDEFGDSPAEAESAIDAALATVDWLPTLAGKPFFVVGGAWRALARVHIDQTKYPLKILHNYEIPYKEAGALAEEVSRLDEKQIAEVSPSVSNRRLTALPHAAMVLARILKAARPEKVVVSGFGLREGIAFEELFSAGEKPDLLHAICRELARTHGRFGDHGDEIERWIAPLFADETAEQRRLHHVTCLLSDIGWAGHPDYRAELVLNDIMHSQLVGVDHAGRAFIALALYVCYGGKAAKAPIAPMMTRMLSPDMVALAETLGLALRLAQRITGGTEGILEKCDLRQDADRIILHVAPENGHLVSEVVERRLRNLANALGREYTIEF